MNRIILTIILILSGSTLVICQETGKGYLGEWKVSNVVLSDIVGELSEKEIEERTGSVVLLQSKQLRIFSSYCEKPVFETNELDIRKYLFLSYRNTISAEKLGISQKEVEVTTITCSDETPESEYFIFGLIKGDHADYILEAEEFFVLSKIKK